MHKFPGHMFDVVLSSLMMHHLSTSLRRQGLTEIVRTLKPGGRLIITDFTHPQQRQGQSATFHAGGSSLHDLSVLVAEAGFEHVETEAIQPLHAPAFHGAGVLQASKV